MRWGTNSSAPTGVLECIAVVLEFGADGDECDAFAFVRIKRALAKDGESVCQRLCFSRRVGEC